MSFEKKTDPLKAADPKVPGVPPSAPKPAPPEPPQTVFAEPREEIEKRPLPAPGIAVAGVIALIVVGALVFWFRSSSPKEGQESVASAADSQQGGEAAVTTEKLAVGPGPVATTDELAKTWAAKRFLFPDPVTTQKLPAMVVHLPDGSYWAFSLREPFGTCELEFVTDLDKLRSDYSFRADHPMIGNPCKSTVYDLLRYGSASNGGLVRGDIVHGTGIRPPVAIEVRVEGDKVVAVQME
jgi:hypothetical protein